MTLMQLLSLPFWLIIVATVLPRVNDISSDKCSIRWQLRRIGLVLTGVAACGKFAGYFTPGPAWVIPLAELAFVMGVALTWLTTPYLPPWHHYLTGIDRAAMRRYTDPLGRLSDELKALRASYWRKSGWYRCPVCDTPKERAHE